MEWEKRECILVEAAKCFAKLGFKKTSVDQIAKGANVAKGTIYNAAESKEDLFYQVLHREVRAWLAETSKAIDPRVPADELLGVMSMVSLKYLEDRPLVKELLFRQAHELMPSWGEKLDELCDLGVESVIAVLKLGQKQGVFREDLDLHTLATLLQDMSLAYFVLHDQARPDRLAVLDRRRKVALDLVLHGIRAPA